MGVHRSIEKPTAELWATSPKCSDVTISDIQTLVNHLFIAGPANAPLKSCL